MNAPDYVQNAYQRTMSDGLPGSFADANPTVVNSFVAEAEEIPFGRVICAGSTFGPPAGALLGGGTIAATAGYLQGSATIATIAEFQAITSGGISVKIDGTARSLTGLNFSSCQTFAAVATVITTALSAYGTCTFSAVTGCFKITSATTGSSSVVNTPVDVSGSTSVIGELGLSGTPIAVAGTASHSAVVLGVTVRSLTVEGGARNKSNTSVVREGDVGAYLKDGTIKVLAKDAASANGTVYFDNTTGEIYAASANGRTQLGTSKFCFNANAGDIAIIDVKGL